MIRWYERLAEGLAKAGVSKAEAGRILGMTGQSVTLKLQGKRPVSVDELRTLSGLAGMTVSEVIGDDTVVLDDPEEIALVELFRMLSPEQRGAWLNLLRGQAKPAG